MTRNSKDTKGKKKKFQVSTRKKVCRFCIDKEIKIDFKDAKQLQMFITERGRILPRRYTGNCAKHQREVTNAVKRARILAFIPFTSTQVPLTI
ncbi:MAG: 30S ribosomal protein S18 [Pseudomonadota bacterium]